MVSSPPASSVESKVGQSPQLDVDPSCKSQSSLYLRRLRDSPTGQKLLVVFNFVEIKWNKFYLLMLNQP